MDKKYPEGYFIGIGIALGIPMGLPLAITTGNFGLMGIGIPIGVAIGVGLEEKYKKEGRIRSLTEKEKKRQRFGVIAGLVTLVLGEIIGLSIFILR